jgi:surfeit locus 1 family protein
MFKRKWIFSTFLVLIAIILMVRLGFWQLDRLEERRFFNTHYLQQIEAASLELNPSNLDDNLENMEYRRITVSGQYDFSKEVAIRNQSYEDRAGVHLLTPLIINESDQAVLIDRGWIPLDAYLSSNWMEFVEDKRATINGIIRLSQSSPSFGGRSDPDLQPGEIRIAWNFVNIDTISQQIPYPVLSIYIQQSPDPRWTDLPHRSKPEVEITEGPHLSYAIQWFTFVIILGIGYPIFIRRESLKTSI